MNKPFERYWGIDVSKGWLDIAIGEEPVIRITNREKAIKAFIKKYKKGDGQNLLVSLESTGGYEASVVQCLSEEGLVVHVAHPNKVKAFAKARGRLAKSDKIDAKILRAYGVFIQADEIKPLRTALQNELTLLGARLAQLKAMHHQERCRLGIASAGVKKSIQGVLALLKKQIEMIKNTIFSLIDSDVPLKEKYALLCSMKGVGATLAIKLITDLPELGEANKKEIAALVGVAPITNNSGQKIGKAMTKYGRCGVRKILYMGALVASRHNPKFQAFYKKLIADGKAPKVALVAVMRKMIVVLNAMVQSKKHFYA
jgi:transposase